MKKPGKQDYRVARRLSRFLGLSVRGARIVPTGVTVKPESEKGKAALQIMKAALLHRTRGKPEECLGAAKNQE
jgi:hypothetical protein